MKINILGYGLMAKQIAALLGLGGYKVYIWNHKKIDLKGLERQTRLIQRATRLNLRGEISVVGKLDDLEDNLTIESVVEDIEVKKNLYFELRGKISNAYCTNSSSLSPSDIGAGVYGLHFFNPIHIKFIEYFEAVPPSDDLRMLLEFFRQHKFEVVPVQNNRGYIGNNVLFNEISSVLKLIEKFHYPVDSINLFYRKFHDGRDILMIIDLIGIDVVRDILTNLKEVDNTLYIPECLSLAISRNILGKKNKTSIKQVLL